MAGEAGVAVSESGAREAGALLPFLRRATLVDLVLDFRAVGMVEEGELRWPLTRNQPCPGFYRNERS